MVCHTWPANGLPVGVNSETISSRYFVVRRRVLIDQIPLRMIRPLRAAARRDPMNRTVKRRGNPRDRRLVCAEAESALADLTAAGDQVPSELRWVASELRWAAKQCLEVAARTDRARCGSPSAARRCSSDGRQSKRRGHQPDVWRGTAVPLRVSASVSRLAVGVLRRARVSHAGVARSRSAWPCDAAEPRSTQFGAENEYT